MTVWVSNDHTFGVCNQEQIRTYLRIKYLFKNKKKSFHNILIEIKIIFLPILGLTCFECNCIDKNKMFSEMEILQCIKYDVVIIFNDVIRIAHCLLNIELVQLFAILTAEWAL